MRLKKIIKKVIDSLNHLNRNKLQLSSANDLSSHNGKRKLVKREAIPNQFSPLFKNQNILASDFSGHREKREPYRFIRSPYRIIRAKTPGGNSWLRFGRLDSAESYELPWEEFNSNLDSLERDKKNKISSYRLNPYRVNSYRYGK